MLGARASSAWDGVVSGIVSAWTGAARVVFRGGVRADAGTALLLAVPRDVRDAGEAVFLVLSGFAAVAEGFLLAGALAFCATATFFAGALRAAVDVPRTRAAGGVAGGAGRFAMGKA